MAEKLCEHCAGSGWIGGPYGDTCQWCHGTGKHDPEQVEFMTNRKFINDYIEALQLVLDSGDPARIKDTAASIRRNQK